jgi:hypothetical protein
MWDKPSEDDTVEWDAANDQMPTQEQRKTLRRDTLRYARLFPPGPERNRLRWIARSLTFFEEDDPMWQPSHRYAKQRRLTLQH